jgi:hypothetical protein
MDLADLGHAHTLVLWVLTPCGLQVLTMEAVCFPETLVSTNTHRVTTRKSHIEIRHRENLKSHTVVHVRDCDFSCRLTVIPTKQ